MKTKKAKSPTFYWSGSGIYQKLADKLNIRIPAAGKVDNHEDNPKLETFRIAQNCYRDLYNNGLCNRAVEFGEIFGFLPAKKQDAEDMPMDDDYKVDRLPRLEKAMDKIILEAAKEAGLKVKHHRQFAKA